MPICRPDGNGGRKANEPPERRGCPPVRPTTSRSYPYHDRGATSAGCPCWRRRREPPGTTGGPPAGASGRRGKRVASSGGVLGAKTLPPHEHLPTDGMRSGGTPGDRNDRVRSSCGLCSLPLPTPRGPSVPVQPMRREQIQTSHITEVRPMSRRDWRCRNASCPSLGGYVLGRITSDAGLVLSRRVRITRAYLDTHRALILCPACATERLFTGKVVIAELTD